MAAEERADPRLRTLAALATAFFPRCPDTAAAAADAGEAALAEFFKLRGEDVPGAAAKVAEMVDRRLTPEARRDVNALLYLLSTRLGTLLLAGRAALAPWPWPAAFADLPPPAHEAALQGWASSSVGPLLKAFKALKSLVAAALFVAVDAGGGSAIHRVLGYAAAPPAGVSRALLPTAAAAEAAVAAALVDARGARGAAAARLAAALSAKGLAARALTGSAAAASTSTPPAARAARAARADVLVECDAVIVGSGAGGGVAAARLAAAGLKVLVVEKGGFARAAELAFAEGAAAPALYEAAGLLATQDGSVSVLAGATLGGGTRVNWSASFRTPAHVRREWAERAGLPAFAPGADGFDAALDAVCARLGVRAGAQPHGAAPSALAAGLAAIGAGPEEVPRNCSSNLCAPGSLCHFGCVTGTKQDAIQTWLADAARDGARILIGAAAERVLLEAAPRGGERGRARRAVGVLALAVEDEGGAGAGAAPPLRLAILAPVVVAAAGAIHTPALLLRSGVVGGGRVGANLRLHPCALVVGLLPRGAPIPRFRAAPGDGGPAAYAAARPWAGPIMSVVSKAAANWDAAEAADAYGALLFTPAVTPALFGAAAPWTSGAAFKSLAARGGDAVAALVLARDEGAGRVALGRDGAPRLHYRLAPRDGAALARGMALAARALAAAGADTVMTCLNAPGGVFAFPASAAEAGAARAVRPDFADFVARVEATGVPHLRMPLLCAHQMGTCALGADAATSVLDPSGESWEVAGLHCLDASLFPTPTGVNPMVTVEAAVWMLAGGLAARAAAAKAARGGGGAAARRPAGELRYEAGT